MYIILTKIKTVYDKIKNRNTTSPRKMARQLTESKNLCGNHNLVRFFYLEYIMNSNNKTVKRKLPTKNEQRIWVGIYSREIQRANNPVKRCSEPLADQKRRVTLLHTHQDGHNQKDKCGRGCVEEKDASHLLIREMVQTWKMLLVPQKVKHRVTLWPSSSTTRIWVSPTESICPYKSLYTNAHSSTIHSNQRVKTVCSSADEWVNRFWCICTMEY